MATRHTTPSLLEYPLRPHGTTNGHLAPANPVQMNQDLLSAKRSMEFARRVLRGAYLAQASLGIDDATVAQYRQELQAAVDVYNEAVRAWHQAWTPWRNAERVRRTEVRAQLRATAQRVEHAKVRAATCNLCNLQHPHDEEC